MRENRPYGSEGGGIEINQSFLPLIDDNPSSGQDCRFKVPKSRFIGHNGVQADASLKFGLRGM